MLVKQPTKREIETKQKKDKIIEVSLALFKEYGFSKTTINDISEASGLSTGSIYNFFGSKSGIISGYIKDNYSNAGKQIIEDVSNDMPLQDALNRYFEALATFSDGLGSEILSAGMQACSDEYKFGNSQEYWDVSMQILIDAFEIVGKKDKWKSELTYKQTVEQIQMLWMGTITTWILYPLHSTALESVQSVIPYVLKQMNL